MIKLFTIMTAPILLASSPSNITVNQLNCSTSVEMAGLTETNDHPQHNLAEEPTGALIAAVDKRIDNCPVLVVIDPKLTGQSAWIPPQKTPEASFQSTGGF